MNRLHNFGFLLKDVSRLASKNFERHANEVKFGLTLEQCKILINLQRNQGITQVRLACLTETDPMTLVRILDRMEQDGWLERRPDPGDRRVWRLHLKPAALPIVKQIWAIADHARGESLDGLDGADIDRLMDLLEKIHGNLVALVPGASELVRSQLRDESAPEPDGTQAQPGRIRPAAPGTQSGARPARQNTQGGAMSTTVSQGGPVAEARPALERLRLPLILLGIIAVAAGTLYFWLSGGRYMSTDDAYVQAAHASISSNIPGRVVEIAVHDNQRVHRGDPLFQLDEQPYRIAVEEAQAKLGSARMEILAGKASYRQQLAALRSAQGTLDYQEREYERQRRLLASGISSQMQFDQAQHAHDGARQQLDSAQQQAASVLALLGGNPDIDPNQHPTVQQAQAALDRALLNLSYTRITAPDDGIVTQVEQLQVGDYINAANPVFALISTRDVWVEANFKEDQLSYMRQGQPATVQIDTYSGDTFTARVSSISPGTGSQFSALPPENATGNWVKVVQRLPVRLQLDAGGPNAELPLNAGLSATVNVDTGHRRGLFGSHEQP